MKIFFETSYYQKYQQTINALNSTFFPRIYFETELEILWAKYEEEIAIGKYDEQTENKIIAQYDKLYSLLLAGSIHDSLLLESIYNNNGDEIKFD